VTGGVVVSSTNDDDREELSCTNQTEGLTESSSSTSHCLPIRQSPPSHDGIIVFFEHRRNLELFGLLAQFLFVKQCHGHTRPELQFLRNVIQWPTLRPIAQEPT